MLQQVMEVLHNYFIKEAVSGSYEIAGGMISPFPAMKDGQRFMICGSDLNDGVYTYKSGVIYDDDGSAAVGLQDEMFAGTICVCAVPPSVLALSEEIQGWVDKYAERMNSPYISENVVGVYSYEKATASKVGGGNPLLTWQDAFSDRLKRWRRMSF